MAKKMVLTNEQKFSITIGKKYKIKYSQDDNPNNMDINVVTVVEGHVVYKRFSRKWHRWVYYIESLEYFDLLIANKFIKEAK